MSYKGGIKCLDNNIDDWTEKVRAITLTPCHFSIVVVLFPCPGKVSINNIEDCVQELCTKLKCM